MLTRVAAAMLLLLASAGAAATNSRPELELALRDLLAWLPGEYSSFPQLWLERRLGAMPEGEHAQSYRLFARIEAPQIGTHVLYSELRAGAPDSALAPGQPLLYVVAIDEQRRSVDLLGRRVRDAERLRGIQTRPELWKQLALDTSAPACLIGFRRIGTQLRGLTDEAGELCENLDQPRAPRPGAEWVLNSEELWIAPAGRADRTHTRYSRLRKFDCSAVYAASGQPATRTFAIHDRGGRAWIWQDAKGGGEQVELFRGLVPTGEPPLLRPQMWLALLGSATAEPIARTIIDGVASRLAVETADTRVSCELIRTPTAAAGAAR